MRCAQLCNALQLTLQCVLNGVELPSGFDERTDLHPPAQVDDRLLGFFPWAKQNCHKADPGAVPLL